MLRNLVAEHLAGTDTMNHWLNPSTLELQSQGAVSFNLKACNYCNFQVIRLVKLHLEGSGIINSQKVSSFCC